MFPVGINRIIMSQFIRIFAHNYIIFVSEYNMIISIKFIYKEILIILLRNAFQINSNNFRISRFRNIYSRFDSRNACIFNIYKHNISVSRLKHLLLDCFHPNISDAEIGNRRCEVANNRNII